MSASKQAVRVELSRIWGSVPLLAALNADGKREIGLALLRHCQSDAHVAAVVETLKTLFPSPPVPQVSTSGFRSVFMGTAASIIASAAPVISSIESPLTRKAVKKAAM